MFHLFLALYCILQELRQLHSHDKKSQWSIAEQKLNEVSPPPDELITQITEQLIITSPADLSIKCPSTPPVVNNDCTSYELHQ